MKISLITPTAGRPVAFALCERMMQRQTLQPDEWIVVDGGEQPIQCTLGQNHILNPSPPGASNFAMNLLKGIESAKGDLVVFIEDDDWYSEQHLEMLLKGIQKAPQTLAAGDDRQNYFNIMHRCWRSFSNVGASLCQTAVRRSAVKIFKNVVEGCLSKNLYGIDTTFWRMIPRTHWTIIRSGTVLGIKGLPGQPGLGIGHRPSGGWNADPNFSQLRKWIGSEADVYIDMYEKAAA